MVGTDFSERMLELARAKAAAGRWQAPRCDSRPRTRSQLPYDDGCFDAATVGFGARNFVDLRARPAEMGRVVKRGGRVVVLEITTPTRPPLSYFFELWFDRVGSGAWPARRRPGGLQLPAELGRRFPRPRRAGGADVAAQGCARSGTSRDRGRHHRAARRDGRVMTIAGAVQAVVDLGGEPVLSLLDAVERRMAELAGGHGALLARYAGETISAGGKRLRPLLVGLAAGAPPPESDGLVRAAVAVELVHARDAGPRRRARRIVAAPRPPDRVRGGRPRPRHRHRRSAVLACVRRAGVIRLGRGGADPVAGDAASWRRAS